MGLASKALLLLAALLVACTPVQGAESSRATLADRIVSELKFHKGFGLDLGCGDARLAIEIAKRTGLMIYCVDPDAKTVAAARKAIDAAGLYGTRACAEQGRLDRLLYPTYCANLIICGDEFANGQRDRDFKELYRVLSPNGVAFVGATRGLTRAWLEARLKEAGIASYKIVPGDGVWARITKPRRKTWDEWTHRSHDPSNTFGSNDTAFGGPYFRMHWINNWRPGLASAAIVAANGRIIVASLEYPRVSRSKGHAPTPTPYLQAVDAYTGIELWARVGKKQLPLDRLPGMYSPRKSCSDIAAVGDRIYLLGGKFCWEFDAATGRTLRKIPIPPQARPQPNDIWTYMACAGDLLFGAAGRQPLRRVDWNTGNWRGYARAVFALNREDGKLLWLKPGPIRTNALVYGAGRFFYCDGGKGADMGLHAIDAKTGRRVWVNRELGYPPRTEIATAHYFRDKVWLFYNRAGWDNRGGTDGSHNNRRELAAFSARTGERLFECESHLPAANVTFAGDNLFLTPQHLGGFAGVQALDPDTGRVKWKIRYGGGKCTPYLATPRCLLASLRRPAVLDLETMTTATFDSPKVTCYYPGIPANGMLYVQAPGCNCAEPLRATFALIPGRPAPADPKNRLLKGTAFGWDADEEADDRAWATWRADARHSAVSAEAAPTATMKKAWSTTLPGSLTPLAAGRGAVFCGSTAHSLVALDQANGKVRWRFFTDGAVTIAPFLWRGRLYASDDAGRAYCLRADDGALIWKFRAALGHERIAGYGRLISRWPARSGVVVHDQTAYLTAGFTPQDGTALYALDARTGAVKWQLITGGKRPRRAWLVPGGAMAVGNGRLVIPSEGGAPTEVRLADPKHRLIRDRAWGGAHSAKGAHVAVTDKGLLVANPGFAYIYHAGAYVVHQSPLPVVAGDVVYWRDGRTLTAEKWSACSVNRKACRAVTAKGGGASLWTAWSKAPMTAVIVSGGVVFSGGRNKVYATTAADGKELWSAAVPGRVDDLAFNGGRLFVATEGGSVAGFGTE